LKRANLRRKSLTIPKAATKQRHLTISRHASARGGFLFHALRLFEIVCVLVRFDHVAPLHPKRGYQHRVSG
jgi:hypothetical protein